MAWRYITRYMREGDQVRGVSANLLEMTVAERAGLPGAVERMRCDGVGHRRLRACHTCAYSEWQVLQ